MFKSFDIPGNKKISRIDYSRLLQKPSHKPIKCKYDKTSLNSERTVSVQTKEDNFNLFDMPWISNLRVMDNAELNRLTKRSGKESTTPAPPSFYDEDLPKFTSKSPARGKSNILKFRNVDVEIKGNPQELGHLIKPSATGSPNRANINFGFGLRKYKDDDKFASPHPWKFPGLRGVKELISNRDVGSNLFSARNSRDAKAAIHLSGKIRNRLKTEKYNDKFPQQNTNQIRHMFSQTSQIGSIKWGSSLRWNNDKLAFINRRKGGKNSPQNGATTARA